VIRQTRRLALAMLLILVAVTLLSNACTSKEKEAVEVSIRLGYYMKPRHAPLYIAIEEGYFEEEGIIPLITEGSGSTDSAVLTAAGEHDIAESSSDAVIVGLAEGMPIKAVGIVQQRNPVALIALQSSGITTVKDIEGKKVGIRPAASSYFQWKIFVGLNDLDPSTITEIAVGFGEEPLLIGEVDLSPVYTSRAKATTEKIEPLVYFEFKDYPELDTYGDLWIVNTEFADKHPDLVEGFLRAFYKGMAVMLKDPQRAADAILAQKPESDAEALLIESTVELDYLVSEETREHGLGYASEEKWARSVSLNLDGGFIEKEVPLKDIFTNEYLPKVSQP